jgi:hypothetical protein
VTSGLAWKLSRLRSMSPAEVAWRVEERVSLAWLAARSGGEAAALRRPAEGFLAAFRASSASLRPPGTREAFAARWARDFPDEPARLAALAAATRGGRVELFARTYEFGTDVRSWPWNRSPDGGPEVALAFGPTLDYRDPARVGNARLAWELARAGWSAAPAMAAYADAGGSEDGERNVRFVVEACEAFDLACPPLRGLQWASALELALRSLSWGWALALVAAHPAADAIVDERWGRLFAHWAEAMRFVEAHDSRYSSANNHRLGEAAGLAWAGHALSFLPEAARWRARGLERMESAFLAQTTPEGVTREHAFAYQQFVLDFVVAAETVAVRAGRVPPPAILARVARTAEALDAFSPGRAAPWAVGDGDEGRALHLAEPYEERVAASLASAYAFVGRAGVVAPHARATWLGLDGGTEAAAGAARGTGASAAGVESLLPERAGYAVERWSVEGRSARLLFDAAPLGLAPLYAHGHADALMVLLDVDGPRLVDPGTGAYHSDPALREKLRATRAHNTVEVDGQDQSLRGGLFQWLAPAPIEGAGVSRRDDGALVAAHGGYRRLGGVVHRRTVRILAPEVIVVLDDLTGAGAHRAVARWHVGDGVPGRAMGATGAVDAAGEAWHVRWPDGFVATLAGLGPSGTGLTLGTGATWAPRFLEPRPCAVLELACEAALPLRLATAVVIGPAEVAWRATEGGLALEVRTARGLLRWRVSSQETSIAREV